eukprot:TRINITY_DN444_c0_g1_i3.p1 TRINITY_DN444_c0_g1~~TRINITY_DN444_c0_g1_i3.p1  ORF type:complete len:2265 (+),score=1319.55 TRINITY_DN444_c0_g1_i3:227-7021(+)
MTFARTALAMLVLVSVCLAVTLPGRIPRGMNRKTTDRLFTDEMTGFSAETVTFGDFATDFLIVDTKVVEGGIVASSGEGHSVQTPGGINFNSGSMDFNFDNSLNVISTGGAVSFLGKTTTITTTDSRTRFTGVDTLFKATGETNLKSEGFYLNAAQGAIRTLEDTNINGNSLDIDGADSFISQSSTGSLTATDGSGNLASLNDNFLVKSGGLFSVQAAGDISMTTDESSIFSSRHGSVAISSSSGLSSISGKNFYAEGLQSVSFIAGNSFGDEDFDLSLSAARAIAVQSDRTNVIGNNDVSFTTTSVNAPITVSSTGTVESLSTSISASSPSSITVQALDRVGFTSQNPAGQFTFTGNLLNLGGAGTIGTSIEATSTFTATATSGDLTLEGPVITVDTEVGGVFFAASTSQDYTAAGDIYFASNAGNALIQGDQKITLNAPIVDFLSEDGISISTGSVNIASTAGDLIFNTISNFVLTSTPLSLTGGVVQFSGDGNVLIQSVPSVRINAARTNNFSGLNSVSLSAPNRVLLSAPEFGVFGSGDVNIAATTGNVAMTASKEFVFKTSQADDTDEIFLETTGTVKAVSQNTNTFSVAKNTYWEADTNTVSAASTIQFDYDSGVFNTLNTFHTSQNTDIIYDTTGTIVFNSQKGAGNVNSSPDDITFSASQDVVGFGGLTLDQSDSLTFNAGKTFNAYARTGRLDQINIGATTSTTLTTSVVNIQGGALTLRASDSVDLTSNTLSVSTSDSRSIYFDADTPTGVINVVSDILSYTATNFFLNAAKAAKISDQTSFALLAGDIDFVSANFTTASSKTFSLTTSADLLVNADTEIFVNSPTFTINSSLRDVDFSADNNFKIVTTTDTTFTSPYVIIDSDSDNDLVGKTQLLASLNANFNVDSLFTNTADSIRVASPAIDITAFQSIVNTATFATTITSVGDLSIQSDDAIFEGGAFHLAVTAPLTISTPSNIVFASTTPVVGYQNDYTVEFSSADTFDTNVQGFVSMSAKGNYEVNDVAVAFTSGASGTNIISAFGGVLLSGDNGVGLAATNDVTFSSSSGIISLSENGVAQFEASSGNIDITAVTPGPVLPSRDIFVSSQKDGILFIADQSSVNFASTAVDTSDYILAFNGDLTFDLSSASETSSNSLSFVTLINGVSSGSISIATGTNDFILNTAEGISMISDSGDITISSQGVLYYRTHAQARPSAGISLDVTGAANGNSFIFGANGVDMFSSSKLSFDNQVSGPIVFNNDIFFAKSGAATSLSFASSTQPLVFGMTSGTDILISTHGILGDIVIDDSFAAATLSTSDSLTSRAADLTTIASAGNYTNIVNGAVSFTTDNAVEKTRIESLNTDITFQSLLANVANRNPVTFFVSGRHIDFSAFNDVTFDPALFQIGKNNDKFNPVVLIEAGSVFAIESVGAVTFTATNELFEIKSQSDQTTVLESSLLVQSNGNIDLISTGNNLFGSSQLTIQAEASNLKVVAFDTIHVSSGDNTLINSQNTILFSSTGTTSSDSLTVSTKNHVRFESTLSSNFTTSQNIDFKATTATLVANNIAAFSSVDPVRKTGQLSVSSDGATLINAINGNFLIESTKANGRIQFQTQLDKSDLIVQTQQGNSDITVSSGGSIEVDSRSVSQTAAFGDLSFVTATQGSGKFSASSTSNVNLQAGGSISAISDARLFIDTDGDINSQAFLGSFNTQDNLAFETANGQGGKIFIDNFTTTTVTAGDELTLSADNDFEILGNGTFTLQSPNPVDFTIDGWIDISNDVINIQTSAPSTSNVDFISSARTKIYSSGFSGHVDFVANAANFDSVNGINIRSSKASEFDNNVYNSFTTTGATTLTSSDDISFNAFQSITTFAGDGGFTINAQRTTGTSLSFESSNPTGNVLFTANSFVSFTGSDSASFKASGLGEGRGTIKIASLFSECTDCANHGIDVAAADVLIRSAGDINTNSREAVISGKQVTITSEGGITFAHNGGDQLFQSIEIATFEDGNIEFETQEESDSSIVIHAAAGFAKAYSNYKTRIVQSNSDASVNFIASGTFVSISQRFDTHPGIQFQSASPQILNALDNAMEFKGRNVRYTLLNDNRSALIQAGTKFGAIIDFQLSGAIGNSLSGTFFNIRNLNGPLYIASTCSASNALCSGGPQFFLISNGISTFTSVGNTLFKAGSSSFTAGTSITLNGGVLPKLRTHAFFGADERGLDNNGQTGAVTITGEVYLRFYDSIADGAYCPYEREIAYGTSVNNSANYQLCACEDNIWSCAPLTD